MTAIKEIDDQATLMLRGVGPLSEKEAERWFRGALDKERRARGTAEHRESIVRIGAAAALWAESKRAAAQVPAK